MSLAQRRTTLDGIEAISLHHPPHRRASLSAEDAGRAPSDTNDTTANASDQQRRHTVHNVIDEREEPSSSSSSYSSASSSTQIPPVIAATVPAEDDKEIWKTISYDPFGSTSARLPDGIVDGVDGTTVGDLPVLQHYESFPAELGDTVAAYEVSTFKRVGE